jgi:ADP-ribose pyrophosphatase
VPDLRDEPASWPVSGSTDLYRGDWVLAVRADELTAPDRPEQTFRRFVVELPGAVMILAVDDDERVVLLRQYRHPVQSRLVEIPAGLLDVPGEDPVLAASSWRHLVTVLPSPGISEERHAIYLARGLSEVGHGDFEAEHEEAEMSVERVPMSELLDAVLDGRVRDAPLVTAVLAYDVLARRGEAHASE